MVIFIYSPQRDISQIISDHLSEKGNICFVFTNQNEIITALKNLLKRPDLVILDYMCFNHDSFNIFQHFKEQNLLVPVLFYNDPCLTAPTRAQHWRSQIEKNQQHYIHRNFDSIQPVLNALEELIEAKEFKKYISLLQPPEKLPKELIKDSFTLEYIQNNENDCIYNFKDRSKLPNNLFYLLKIFQEHKTTPITLDEILEIYKNDNKEITDKSLKVLISTLKNKIRKDKECKFFILTENNTYRFIKY